MRRYTIPALLAAAAIVSTPAIACDSLGENMHMGNIVSIDQDSGTFILRDAESQKPIRFSVAKETLSSLAVNDRVEIAYEVTSAGELRATSLDRM